MFSMNSMKDTFYSINSFINLFYFLFHGEVHNAMWQVGKKIQDDKQEKCDIF